MSGGSLQPQMIRDPPQGCVASAESVASESFKTLPWADAVVLRFDELLVLKSFGAQNQPMDLESGLCRKGLAWHQF